MENIINSYETNKEIIDINIFEIFLIKCGYISQKTWTKNNSDLFDPNKFNEIIKAIIKKVYYIYYL